MTTNTELPAWGRQELDRQMADAAQWRARYLAAHDVLLLVEELIESEISDGANGLPSVSSASYRSLRAAFFAYRASIEAGAPLAWMVAEEPDAAACGVYPAHVDTDEPNIAARWRKCPQCEGSRKIGDNADQPCPACGGVGGWIENPNEHVIGP